MTGWTPTMDATLEQSLADGIGAREIAKRMGVSRNAVLGRVRRIGLSVPRGRRPTPGKSRRPEPTQAPVNRDPCWRCGVRNDVGCVHSRAAA